MGTVQNTANLGGGMEKRPRSTIVGFLQEGNASENMRNEGRINRFQVSLVAEENLADQGQDKEGAEEKVGKVRKEKVGGSREHFAKVKEGKEFRLKKFQVCNVAAVVEKLDRRNHQLSNEALHHPTIRSLPVQRKRFVRWWDGYTPERDAGDVKSCQIINSTGIHHCSSTESTSTVRAGSHLAKLLAAQIRTWK